MYYLTASLIGLVAYALLASPLSPRSADILGGWHPLAVLPMVAAATISAVALRSVVRHESKSSLLVAGVACPFLSSLLFAGLFGFLERKVQGGLAVGSAMAEALLGCVYGPLYCGLLAYFTIPLGILGVMALRRVSAHAHSPADAA